MKRVMKRGFTLLELLIVIAIIGILSAIILSSLGNSRQKSVDAKTRQQMARIRTAAELYYSNNSNSYGPASSNCTPGTATGMWANTTSGMAQYTNTAGAFSSGVTPLVCNSSNGAYAVQANLLFSGSGFAYWCVDSKGTGRGTNVALGAATVCP